jgi:DNA-binding NarL/FixJ family response regulator
VKQARILIVDDHELVRKGMRAILENVPGWSICGEAATGREAVAKAIELKPDVVALDLGLPDINGLEVVRRIRQRSNVAVLIVSMHESDHLVQEALDAGANGYVLKADAGRTLADAVRAVLSSEVFISDRVHLSASPPPPDIRDAGASQVKTLTSRELEVLQLLAKGHANKQIAATLGISTKTAETHRAHIMAKLELHSAIDLVRYAIRHNIVEP